MTLEVRLREAASSLDRSVPSHGRASVPSFARRLMIRRASLALAMVAAAALVGIPMLRELGASRVKTADQPKNEQKQEESSENERGGVPAKPGSDPASKEPSRDGGGTRSSSGTVQGATGLSPTGGRVIFESGRDGNQEIYAMNPDGSGQTRLTNNSANDGEPAWAPSGQRIAFVSNREGSNAIYVMKADGSGQGRLISVGSQSVNPAWSPDGERIAFVVISASGPTSGKGQIWVGDADGSNLRQLTSGDRYDSRTPSWSPDSSRIVFFRTTSGTDFGDDGLWIAQADGSDLSVVNNTDVLDRMPAWSSDGSRIAFMYRRQILTMNPDGSDRKALTNTSDYDGHPAWSSDGSQIFFDRDPDGHYGFACGITTSEAGCPYVSGPVPPAVWRMNADGSAPQRLTLGDPTNNGWWPSFATVKR
jgi:Tol biopolymer transport system component